ILIDLIQAESADSLDIRADEDETELRVDGPENIRDVFDQRSIPLFTFAQARLGALPGGDIPADATHAPELTIGAEDRSAPDFEHHLPDVLGQQRRDHPGERLGSGE